MLSTTTIDQVRDLPIEQVINNYVTLKKSGGGWAACCPLPNHSENTPSFHVTPSKNMFKCFGCGAGGDAIAFVMLHEGFTFIDAVKAIAGDHGIAVVEKDVKGKTPEEKADEVVMSEWLFKAQVKYRDQLHERPSILQYLKFNRGFTDSTIIEWQFGAVPDWRVIVGDVMAMGKFDACEKAGLVRKSENNQYDFYHHRITVPAHNTRGEIIGFSGRVCPAIKGAESDSRKYINPPDSPLYNKSKVLFGLDKAIRHIKAHGMAVLVEGNWDTITLHQEGFNNTVASGGTALTESQAKLLKRYTDTVLILRDGDNAGTKAIDKDIPILLSQQLTVLVFTLPRGYDPDDYFRLIAKERLYSGHFYTPLMVALLDGCVDGVAYAVTRFFESASNPVDKAKALEKSVALLALITNGVQRDFYIKSFCAPYKLKATDFTKPLTKALQQREEEREAAKQINFVEVEAYPHWVDRKHLDIHGFVQLRNHTEGYTAGIYFSDSKNKYVYQVTNFTIAPLYHIYDQSNNRRLIEIDNTHRSSVVELPTQATINQGNFEAELMNKGNFMCYDSMKRPEFKRMIAWMVSSMPIAYELKTLGWQPEGFFAYSNAVYHDDKHLVYDELGMICVDEKHYMSLGNSKIHRDERQIDNPYENDLYLKYIEPREGMNFEKWAQLFNVAYGSNAPYGIAFTFLTLFKDIVTRVTKMPLLYCYGQKGAGKSDMAESILWLFFSGKDAEGGLMRGFNLNPGQSTHFSFFNRLERFRNCPIVMNEFDENSIEPWKSGTMKAAYDGEGREVGDGDTGKKRKTKIQKVQGTIILVGQYMATKDDAAVSSRSIPCNFSVERLKNLSDEGIAAHTQLKSQERTGLCFIINEMLKYRPEVQKELAKSYTSVQSGIMEKMRSEGYRIEARLISNYSIMLAATHVLVRLGIKLPYTYDEFYAQSVDRMIKHNQTLKDNSIVGQFWKAVEVLFDKGLLKGTELVIRTFADGIDIKDGTHVSKVKVPGEVLLIRFSNVYAEYAKYHRERTSTAAQGEETVLMYLKEQTYFIGLAPVVQFSEKRTSAYAFNYEAMKEMGSVLVKIFEQKAPSTNQAAAIPELRGTDDQPF